MDWLSFTHQVEIDTPRSAHRNEVERNFPYKDEDEYTFSLPMNIDTIIYLKGALSDEQRQWLALQKEKGIIKRWRIEPIYGAKRQKENVLTKDLRLTIELVPKPCFYNNLRNQISRSAWDTLRKQVYAQYNYHCGICDKSHVQLHCHEIWHYDDTLHIQKLHGFISLCAMCHRCKHIGHTEILDSQGKLDFNEVVEHFMRVNQCSQEEYEAHWSQAMLTWNERSKFDWTTDLGSYAHLVQKAT